MDIEVLLTIEKKTNDSLEGIFQCAAGDDLCYKGRGNSNNFIQKLHVYFSVYHCRWPL